MENEKQIDESWKESVAQDSGSCSDKAESAECGAGCSCSSETKAEGDQAELKVDFMNYVMSMAYQAMIFLGEVPNPMTQKKEKNLRQAKFLIDTLLLLKEKTRGNLTGNEDNMLNSSIAELQMKYVEASK